MKVGDTPVAFRATRDQARLLRDACRHYSKTLAAVGRGPRAKLRSVEALRTSILLGYMAKQIELALSAPIDARPPRRAATTNTSSRKKR